MGRDKVVDVEKVVPTSESESDRAVSYGEEGTGQTFLVGQTWYAKTQRFFNKFGVEARGIERVPANERTTDPLSQIGTLVRDSDRD